MLRYVVLGLLRSGCRHHGYALMKQYRALSGVQGRSGSFYRELQRLVSEGLVHTVPNPDGADPRRAPYQITQSGCDVFDAWLGEMSSLSHDPQADELSSRALFLGDAEPTTVRELLSRWEDEFWIRSKILERTREAARSRLSVTRGDGFPVLSILLARRLKQLAADLECLQEMRAAYEESLLRHPGSGDTRRALRVSRSAERCPSRIESITSRVAVERRNHSSTTRGEVRVRKARG